MQCAFPSKSAKALNGLSQLSEINERLSLALQSSNQVAFDWHIIDDRLYFSGSLNDKLQDLLLDTSKTWQSSALPSIIHEEDRANFRTRLHEALKGNANAPDSHYQAELRLKDSVRGWRWVKISGQIVERNDDGVAIRMAGTFSDIDERKRAENRSAQLRDLYATLSQTNQTIARIQDRDYLFKEICRIAVEQGHFGMAWIGAMHKETSQISPIAGHAQSPAHLRKIANPAGGAIHRTQCVFANAIHENNAKVCNELSASRCFQQCDDLAGHAAFQSFGCFPLQLLGKPFGTLNLYAYEADFFDAEITELLEELALDISFAIDNLEHEARRQSRESALRESEKIKSAILTSALDCIVTIDQNGDILSVNKAAEQTFGFRGKEVYGKKLTDIIIPPGWREHHRHEIARFLMTGESNLINRRIEITAMRADNSPLQVELAIVPILTQEQPIFTAFIRDISDLKKSQEVLQDRAKHYRQLVDMSPHATLVCKDNRIALLNHAAVRLLGGAHTDDLLGRSILDFVDADFNSFLQAGEDPQDCETTSPIFVEQVWRNLDGQRFDAEVGATKLMLNDAPSIQLVIRDITARKRAEALQLGQNRILNMVATGVPLPAILIEIAGFAEAHSDVGICSILQLRHDGRILSERIAPSLSQACLAWLGEEEVRPNNQSCGTAAYRNETVVVTDIGSDPLWDAAREDALAHNLKACTSRPIIGKNRKTLGTFALYFRDAISPSEADMELSRICANLAGIAIESRASEERIRYLAHYDGLTSLPNRFLFKEYLDLALRNAQRHRKKFAVLFLDLDKFKEINDTLGHDAGDLVLREMAKRLRSCLRHNDKIARMGGDEFYVLIEDLSDGGDAAEVAQKLLDEAVRPIYIGGNTSHLSVSIGIGIYPDDGGDGHTLLKNADKAMYRAKEQGKNGFQFFSRHDAPGKADLALIRPSRNESKKHMRLA